jgi:hypothetical protein
MNKKIKIEIMCPSTDSLFRQFFAAGFLYIA